MILSSSLKYLICNIASALLPFMLLPILTEKLSTNEFGQLSMFFVFVTLTNIFIGFSVQNAVNRKYFDHVSEGEFSDYIVASIYFLSINSLIILLIINIFESMLDEYIKIPSEWYFYSVVISLSTFIFQIRIGQWQIKNEVNKYILFQFSSALASFLLVLLLLYFFELRSLSRVYAHTLIIFIFSVFSIYSLKQEFNILSCKLNLKSFKEVIKYNIPLFPHLISIFIVSSVDKLYISKYYGTDNVALYMVAFQLCLIFNMLYDSVSKAYLPRLFHILSEPSLELLVKEVKLTYLYFLIILILSFIMFLFGPLLVVTIAGEKYKISGAFIGYLCLGQSFNAMYLIVSNYISFSKKTIYLSYSTTISSISFIFIMFLLGNIYGIEGVAISYCLGQLIKTILTWYFANKSYKLPWLSFWYKN